MKRISPVGLCLLLTALLGGCAASNVRQATQQKAATAGFQELVEHTEVFKLYTLYRPAAAQGSDTLHVYIEGDGRAWRQGRAPADPTPNDSAALRLALADPSSGPVLYLARPCQYLRAENPLCAPRYWSTARLGREVLASLNAAVSAGKARSGAGSIVLIGYSGGGGAAALLAARRDDVVFLATAAGMLHAQAWTDLHRVTPLHDSLDPITAAPDLSDLPQRHLSSPADSVLPPAISANFCRAARQLQSCVQKDGISHAGAWESVWDYNYRP